MTSIVFVIIAMVLVYGYITALCVANRDIPSSLSEAVYNLKPSQSWLWSLCMALAGFFTIPRLMEVSSDNTRFLAFLCIAGLLVAVVCPLMQEKSSTASKIYTTGVIICALCSQSLIAVNNVWPLLLWFPYFGCLWHYSNKEYYWRTQVFWVEIVMITTTFTYALFS